MTERLRRLAAVIRADLLIRFRRPSTVVVFLLLSAFAYMWIPDPATGRTLLVIDSKRAVYNSAAIGMATAMIGTIFIGLAGFYVISNAIRRDVLSRCGYVIASTQMRAGEYLIGKIAGNIVFLSTFMLGFMATSMVMLIVRGEAPLEPLLFAKQYLILAPAAIVFVSVIAIVFESVPFLAGKLGDVLYFFLWSGSLGAVVSNLKGNDPGVAGYFDISGFGFLKTAIQTDHVSIGASSFDAAKGLHVFNGLEVPAAWIAPRLVSTFGPLLLVVVALLFFHRFDPARLRKAIQKGSRSWLSRIGMLAKPLARAAYAIVPRGRSSGVLSAASADVLMALTAVPASVVVILIVAIAGLTGSLVEVFPIAFAAAAVLIADVASREKRAGTTGLVYSAPLLKQRFVSWKFLSALLMTALVVAVPVFRMALTRPAALLPLAVGIAFIAATATALGVVSANPKTFIVVFLTFWYLMVSDHGRSAGLDFAGFYGKATPTITAAYAACAVAALAMAQVFHRAQLRRSW